MLDLWKSIAGEHYLGVTVSFIDEDWTMRAIALAVRPVLVSHTSSNIKDLTTSVLQEFGIVPQCYVADNASNQVLANDLLADWSNEKSALARGDTLKDDDSIEDSLSSLSPPAPTQHLSLLKGVGLRLESTSSRLAG